MKTLLVVSALILLAGCRPSCEQRGGKLVQHGVLPVTNLIYAGNNIFIPIMSFYPNLVCEGASQS